MMSRLKPILCVLLALVVCGASSQATVCELSCALDARGTSCHMAAASHEAAMRGMLHGHCGQSMRAAGETDKGGSVGSLDGMGCGHTFFPAIESSVAAKARFAAAAWSFSYAASAERQRLRGTALPQRRPPPLLASASPLLVILRV